MGRGSGALPDDLLTFRANWCCYGGHIAENLQDALPRKGAIALRAVVAALLFAFFRHDGLVRMALHGTHHVPDDTRHPDPLRLRLRRHVHRRPAADRGTYC